MKKIIFLLIVSTLFITGCSIPTKNNNQNISSESSSVASEIISETTESISEEIIYAVSLESEINKMQNIIFTTALAAIEEPGYDNIHNEKLIWKSIYYYLNHNYNYNLDNISVENIGKIFSGFFGLDAIYDETILDKNMISLNREKLTYNINKINKLEYTYYISDYRFDKTDIIIIINLYDKKENLAGSYKFVLDKTNKITKINDIDYKYKIKSFEEIKIEANP